jgi:hypothetical protein
MAETLTRIDPKSSPVDGDRSSGRLINKDPRRHYVLANPNCEDTGVALYESNGYRVETLCKDGPRFAGGRTSKEGDRVVWKGQMLMSCPLEEHQAYEQSKLDHAAMVDRRSVAPGGVDGVLGGTGKLAYSDPSKSELFVPTR